jgi:hypothetical protein
MWGAPRGPKNKFENEEPALCSLEQSVQEKLSTMALYSRQLNSVRRRSSLKIA